MSHAEKIKAWRIDRNPNALLMDGFDNALVGVGGRIGVDVVAIYDRDKCIEALIGMGMTDDEAEEHFRLNCEGSYVGPGTPLIGCFDFDMIPIEDARAFLAEE